MIWIIKSSFYRLHFRHRSQEFTSNINRDYSPISEWYSLCCTQYNVFNRIYSGNSSLVLTQSPITEAICNGRLILIERRAINVRVVGMHRSRCSFTWLLPMQYYLRVCRSYTEHRLGEYVIIYIVYYACIWECTRRPVTLALELRIIHKYA